MSRKSDLSLDQREVSADRPSAAQEPSGWVEALTKGFLGLLAITIGAGIIAWVLYNELVKQLPQYERPPLVAPLGLGPLMISTGIYWVSQSLRCFAEHGNRQTLT